MIVIGTAFGSSHIVEEKHFPDGTLKLDLPDITPSSISWYYENDAELFTLMCVREHYGKIPCLYIPYLPHARMDRVKAVTDVFTLKTFANAINAMGFERVRMLDVHSNVGLALINNAEPMPLTLAEFHSWVEHEVTTLAGTEDFVAFYPDEGAMKRYSDTVNRPYAFGIKKRDWETGNILGLDIMYADRVKGKNVLIIDDICSRGGTFYHSAKALKQAGAKRVFLCVTHAEETMLEGDAYKEKGLIDHIFTTNSLFKHESSDKISVYELD